jgi:hypothetical protein
MVTVLQRATTRSHLYLVRTISQNIIVIRSNFNTFFSWEWFYAAMKVTREHLRGPWNDGSIVGFIHKRTAEDLLLKCQRGTFLLRFSDSELGKNSFTFYFKRLLI